ncbi:MAG: hypothetical protein KDA37_15010 [Planctomycetales bacterium]|nr:hypothetical protein [Planctomycetales bacterium]
MSRHALLGLLCLHFTVAHAAGVQIVLDYTYDTTHFFGSGNPNGAAAGATAKATLEEAARFLSESLEDTLSPISTPDFFRSTVSSGIATWQWSLNFTNPTTASTTTLYDEDIVANEYRIYVGARSLSGSTVAEGGRGGFGYSYNPQGSFSASEISQLDNITDQFISSVTRRGEPEGEFANWGGFLTIDRDGSTDWHYDWTTTPASNKTDFYSVVVHELVHGLGFGTSTQWTDLVTAGKFMGQQAYLANGNVRPSVTGGHWAANTASTIVGTSQSQEASLDPNIDKGQRKYLTTLDAAALRDIGWDVQYLSPLPPGMDGDFNNDGQVDAADYALWRDHRGAATEAAINYNGNGGGIDQSDYNLWRANYGATSAIAATTTPVTAPEPAAGWLVLSGLSLGLPRRRPTGRRL